MLDIPTACSIRRATRGRSRSRSRRRRACPRRRWSAATSIWAISIRARRWSLEVVLRNDNGAAVGYALARRSRRIWPRVRQVGPGSAADHLIAGVTCTLTGHHEDKERAAGGVQRSEQRSATPRLDAAIVLCAREACADGRGRPEPVAFDHDVATTTGNLSGAARSGPSRRPITRRRALGTLPAGLVQDGAGSDDGPALRRGLATALPRRRAARVVSPCRSASWRPAASAGSRWWPARTARSARSRSRTGLDDGDVQPDGGAWWFAGVGDETVDGQMLARPGGFADVAADRGRAWYVDACKGELGEGAADRRAPRPRGPRQADGDRGLERQAWIGTSAPPRRWRRRLWSRRSSVASAAPARCGASRGTRS